MRRLLRIKYFQFLEYWHQEGFLSACACSLYRREEAVPVEKDLQSLRAPKKGEAGLELVDMEPDTFEIRDLRFPLRSRRERAERNFALGYRGFALLRQGNVIADVWYVTRATAGTDIVHPHLHWFGIPFREEDVYLFDMHVSSDERGNAISTFFLTTVLLTLRGRGFRKAYGYFAANNVPALWVHRLIGYRELPRVILRRFLIYETAKAKG